MEISILRSMTSTPRPLQILTLALAITACTAGKASAEEQWYIGPRIGISPFTAVVGIEAQRRHIAVSAGIPGTYGLKYYFSFPKHSWFLGVCMTRYNIRFDDVEFEEGAPYDHKTVRREGGGGGYRWRWKNGWDLELALAVTTVRDTAEYQGRQTLTWSGASLFPGLSFGYSF